MNQRLQTFISDCSGAMAVIAIMLLTLLLSAAALGIDYGYMAWVQSELKKAADAGALAGARELVPYTGNPPTPDWAQAKSAATQTVLLNWANGQLLTDCTVNYGYWSLTAKTLPLQSSAIIPTASDVPAVHVQIAKNAGHNGGPLQMMFAPIFGVKTFALSGQSVAMISFPTGVEPGALKPMIATQDIIDKYWDKPDGFKFKIGDQGEEGGKKKGKKNGDDEIEEGMWTSFKDAANDAKTVKDLMEAGNPTTLKVNDNIYLQPGTEATLYGAKNMGQFINQTVVLPIVAPNTLEAKTKAPILGFIAFHITDYSQGSKYIEGYFDKDFLIENGIGAGLPPSGSPSTSNPPKLVY